MVRKQRVLGLALGAALVFGTGAGAIAAQAEGNKIELDIPDASERYATGSVPDAGLSDEEFAAENLAWVDSQEWPNDDAKRLAEILAGVPYYDPAYWADEYPAQYADFVNPSHAYYAENATGKVNSYSDAHKLDYVDNGFSYQFCICHVGSVPLLIEGFDGDYEALWATQTQENVTDTYDKTVDGLYMGVTCYACHDNDPETLSVPMWWISDAMEESGIDEPMETKVCIQCHSRYNLSNTQWTDDDPNYGDVSDPSEWSTLVVEQTPQAIHDYLKENGLLASNPVGGHTEYDNFYNSVHYQAGATCVDCHMMTGTDEDGNEYTVHDWYTVNDNEELYANCQKCHTDQTVDEIKAMREEAEDAYAADIADMEAKYAELSEQVEELRASGTKSDDEMAELDDVLLDGYFYMYCSRNGVGPYDWGKGFHGLGEDGSNAVSKRLAWDAFDQLDELLK